MKTLAFLVLITSSGMDRHPTGSLAACERIIADHKLNDLGAFCAAIRTDERWHAR